jgi:hypothetical protein
LRHAVTTELPMFIHRGGRANEVKAGKDALSSTERLLQAACQPTRTPRKQPLRAAHLGQAKFLQSQSCTLEIGQFHFRILS